MAAETPQVVGYNLIGRDIIIDTEGNSLSVDTVIKSYNPAELNAAVADQSVLYEWKKRRRERGISVPLTRRYIVVPVLAEPQNPAV